MEQAAEEVDSPLSTDIEAHCPIFRFETHSTESVLMAQVVTPESSSLNHFHFDETSKNPPNRGRPTSIASTGS
jgi:hypothetical protein